MEENGGARNFNMSAIKCDLLYSCIINPYMILERQIPIKSHHSMKSVNGKWKGWNSYFRLLTTVDHSIIKGKIADAIWSILRSPGVQLFPDLFDSADIMEISPYSK